jgi:hypothetical protein
LFRLIAASLPLAPDGVIDHHAESGDRFDADLVLRSVNALLDPVMRR